MENVGAKHSIIFATSFGPEVVSLPRKESHTALILYFDWLMFYAKNEAADIFFVMKPKTCRISLFHAAV